MLCERRGDSLLSFEDTAAARHAALEQARAALDLDAFEAAWSSSHELPLEGFLAEVRAWTPESPREQPPGHADASRVLTARERDVVVLVVQGLSDKKVAQTLGISMGTVSKHLANILGKLKLHNRVALTRWAIEHHLTPQNTPPSS